MMRRHVHDATCPEALRALLMVPRTDASLANGERWVWLRAVADDDLALEYAGDGYEIGGAVAKLPELPPQATPEQQAEHDKMAYEAFCHDWLQYERDMVGLEDLLGIDQWRTGCGTASWLAQNGIAPGQPFLVHFDPPRYWRSWTDYGYEYDSEFTYDVAAIDPWPREQVIEAWLVWACTCYVAGLGPPPVPVVP